MKVKIEFEIELPDIQHTDKQLKEFLMFEFGDSGEIKCNNPFYESDICLNPIIGTFKCHVK